MKVIVCLAFFCLVSCGTDESSKKRHSDNSGSPPVKPAVSPAEVLVATALTPSEFAIIEKKMERFKICSIAYNTSKFAELTLEWTIDPEGHFKDISMRENVMGNKVLVDCMVEVLKTVRFPASKNGQSRRKYQTFTFFEGEAKSA